jgi:hypothetical protein
MALRWPSAARRRRSGASCRQGVAGQTAEGAGGIGIRSICFRPGPHNGAQSIISFGGSGCVGARVGNDIGLARRLFSRWRGRPFLFIRSERRLLRRSDG